MTKCLYVYGYIHIQYLIAVQIGIGTGTIGKKHLVSFHFQSQDKTTVVKELNQSPGLDWVKLDLRFHNFCYTPKHHSISHSHHITCHLREIYHPIIDEYSPIHYPCNIKTSGEVHSQRKRTIFYSSLPIPPHITCKRPKVLPNKEFTRRCGAFTPHGPISLIGVKPGPQNAI